MGNHISFLIPILLFLVSTAAFLYGFLGDIEFAFWNKTGQKKAEVTFLTQFAFLQGNFACLAALYI